MNNIKDPNAAPYTRYEVIGRGSYGVVYKGLHNVTKAAVAIKVLNLDTVEEEVSDIQKEIVLLQSLKAGDAQNVIRYHGSFLVGTRLWIITDHCQGGSIRTLMKSGRIEEKFIVVIIREVLAALTYIHKADIIHRDIKAANILMTNEGRVQLCDFGVAAQLAANHFKRNTFVGTPYWMAPEVISDGLSYNYKADIWSLGITIYEIATGNPPYADQEPMRAIFLIPRNVPTRLEGSMFSSQIKEFVAACLCEKPEDRMSAPDLLKTRCMKIASKTPISILRELISRYEAWRKSGGVRKSLAMGGDIDLEDDFDSNFGLDDVAHAAPDEWDFGTVRTASGYDVEQPTWEQSADATEDLLRTIRPTNQPTIAASQPIAANARYEHPLLQLFGETKPALTLGVGSQSMLDLSSGKTALMSEPSTPVNETVMIEMPALNATSLASMSSVSLPALPLTSGSSSSTANVVQGDGASRFAAPHEVQGLALAPARQDSFDFFSNQYTRSIKSDGIQDDSDMNSKVRQENDEDLFTGQWTSKKLSASPPKPSQAPSPTRSRPTSPTRLQLPGHLSPPPSPSRRVPSNMHSTSTSASSMNSVAPIGAKTSFNSSLGLVHLHTNSSSQSLPDILPRPNISGATRDRSPSNSALPLLKQHMKRPSNLVLQKPGLVDTPDKGFLPPSPSRLMMPSNAGNQFPPIQSYTSTPLTQEINATTSHVGDDAKSPKAVSSRVAIQLPELAPLNFGVLCNNDHDMLLDELTRVVADMLGQLTHVENGLSSMTYS